MKRTTHYSEAEEFMMMKDWGINESRALILVKAISSLSFEDMDRLSNVIEVIRKGKEA